MTPQHDRDTDELMGDDADLASSLALASGGAWGALRAYSQRTRSALARRALLHAAASDPGDHYAHAMAAMLLAVDPGASTSDLDRARELLGDLSLLPIDGETWPEIAEACGVVAQALLRGGRGPEALELLEQLDLGTHLNWVIRTDLVNPTRIADRSAPAITRFLGEFNRLFLADGIEPIALDHDTPPEILEDDFLAVRARAARPEAGDDLITVVMSAYRPGPELRTAVRSIRDQSWQAWELLIVDDESGPEYHDLLDEVAASDTRIRVLHAPVNSGTYAARNLALKHAQGRYMTFQDSDDWSHPQRLERQVRALQADPRRLANRSWAIRAYPDLTVNYPGYPAHRLNASSLMFDRPRTQRLIGEFDHVRISADVELPSRLLAADPQSVADLPELGHLAITLLRHGSLSRTDAVPGWMRWTRTSYKDGFLAWHREIRAGRASARLASTGPRPFTLPSRAFDPDRSAPPVPTPELVVLGDIRRHQPRAAATAELARVLSSEVRVGLAHAETPLPLSARRQSAHPTAQSQLSSGSVSHAHVSAEIDVPVVVVTEPASLLHIDDVQMTADRVLVIADTWESNPTWDVSSVNACVEQRWSVSPIWALTGERPLSRFAAQHPAATIWPEPLPWVVAPGRATSRRDYVPDSYRVVGHHLPDEPARWPKDATISAARLPRHIDLRLLEGTSAARALLGRASNRPGWVDLSRSGMSVAAFLDHLDVFLHLGRYDATAEVAVLQALAAGLPVVSIATDGDISGDLAAAIRQTAPNELIDAIMEAGADSAGAVGLLDARASIWRSAARRLILDGGSVSR